MYVCVSDCIDIRMYEYIYILHMSLPQIPIERQLHILIKPQLKQANNFFPSYIPLKIGTYTLTHIYIYCTYSLPPSTIPLASPILRYNLKSNYPTKPSHQLFDEKSL